MMNTAEAFRLLVELASVNDASAFRAGLVERRGHLSPAVVRALADASGEIEKLFKSYEYTDSPSFHKSIEGKSAAYVSMKRKLEAVPIARAERLREFEHALSRLLESSDVFELLNVSLHPVLRDIARNVKASAG